MKKLTAYFLLIFILILNIIPFTAYGTENKPEARPQPAKPYEKVLAKSGSWYSEQIDNENGADLIVAYQGNYINGEDLIQNDFPEMSFSLNEKTVLTGIYLPYAKVASGVVSITLKDNKGNIYGPYKTEKTFANLETDQPEDVLGGISDLFGSNSSGSVDESDKDGQVLVTVDEKKPSLDECANYVFSSDGKITLPEGTYSMTATFPEFQVRNLDTDEGGAFLVRGINFEANERYNRDIFNWTKENNPELTDAEVMVKIVGDSKFGEEDFENYKYEKAEKPPVKKPAGFSLDKKSLVSEIVINTYNDGDGATPGSISILDSKGVVILTEQAYGGTLGGISNGVWAIAPNLVLPKGNYFVGISDPKVVTYDKFGNPQFMVTIGPPPPVRNNFTGTYSINLDAYKTSTLKGPVKEKNSSFSLKDFELSVLDKEDSIEIVGKYQGIPFSQECTITESSENKLVALFEFSADLSNLPYKAKISVSALVTLSKESKKKAKISIEGSGIYDRKASEVKGADYNTYTIKANGMLKQKDLPPFIIAALGKSEGAGNVPGPGGTGQAAAGILFPPLVGLVVHVIQQMIKSKPETETPEKDESDEPKKYTKAWYAKKYPGKTDEQLAWLMLGDAMGNSDNPDPGDSPSGSGSGDSTETSSGDSSEGGNEDSGGNSDSSGNDDSDGSSENSGDGDSENSASDDTGNSDGDDSEGGNDSDNEDSSDDEDSQDSEDNSDDEDESEDDSNSSEEDDDSETEDDEDDWEDEDDTGEDEDDWYGEDDETDSQGTDKAGDKTGENDSKENEQVEDKPEEPEEPETLTVQTDYTGRTTTYVKDKATGEWINPETGGVFDQERYEKDVKPNFEKDKAFVDEQRDKLERGDTAFDKELREAEAARKQAAEKEAYMDKLEKKYGTSDKEALEKIIEERKQKDMESSEAWQTTANRYETAETVASVTGVIADNAIDGLANVTGPAGKSIRAGYKVIKNVAGTMAEDGVSAKSFVSGTIKGGTDAATDYIDNGYVKAGVTIAGEVAAGAVSDGAQGAKEGLVDGVFKVGVGGITDKVAGNGFGNDVTTMGLKNGNVRVAIKSGEKWIGKNLTQASADAFINKKNIAQVGSSLIKTGSGLLDEFGIKPGIVEPIKDNLKGDK